jgi:hypothetical protein
VRAWANPDAAKINLFCTRAAEYRKKSQKTFATFKYFLYFCSRKSAGMVFVTMHCTLKGSNRVSPFAGEARI